MPRNPAVDAFMAMLEHPFKAELEAVRAVILAASPQIEEAIKWKTPTFSYRGNMASLVVRTKRSAQLMFHQGALLPDPAGMLEGDGKAVRMAHFDSLEAVAQRGPALTALVEAWIRARGEGKRP